MSTRKISNLSIESGPLMESTFLFPMVVVPRQYPTGNLPKKTFKNHHSSEIFFVLFSVPSVARQQRERGREGGREREKEFPPPHILQEMEEGRLNIL